MRPTRASLVALALVAARRKAPWSRESLALGVPRFSRLAGLCLLAVAVTGSYNTWTQLGGFSRLVTTAYGRVLIAKLAVAAGLVFGKPLGIVACSWLALRSGLAVMPAGVGWGVLLGAGALAGIGFTMSLFIAGLALDGPLLNAAKLGTLAGSLVSASLGMALLAACLPREKALPRAADEA